MENFIYSVDATFPIFLVMVIGYILKQIGMLNDNFVTVANRFNFKVTLPFMLFRDIPAWISGRSSTSGMCCSARS